MSFPEIASSSNSLASVLPFDFSLELSERSLLVRRCFRDRQREVVVVLGGRVGSIVPDDPDDILRLEPPMIEQRRRRQVRFTPTREMALMNNRYL